VFGGVKLFETRRFLSAAAEIESPGENNITTTFYYVCLARSVVIGPVSPSTALDSAPACPETSLFPQENAAGSSPLFSTRPDCTTSHQAANPCGQGLALKGKSACGPFQAIRPGAAPIACRSHHW